MFTGVTEYIHENNRVSILKKIRIVTALFILTILLPFIIYFLFYFGIVTGKGAFNSNIQEPVAKVIVRDGVGTAFLISPTTLLTARHVVENYKVGDQVDLIFEHSKNQFQTKAIIKFITPTTQLTTNDAVPLDYFLSDVAILEIPEVNDITPLVLGESDAVVNLDEVILIGYPNGDYSITKGNINSNTYQGLNLFKLDAASNPGNSGGPCIRKDDNTVIGILVGGSLIAKQGENIAVKIDDVKKILEKAKINY